MIQDGRNFSAAPRGIPKNSRLQFSGHVPIRHPLYVRGSAFMPQHRTGGANRLWLVSEAGASYPIGTLSITVLETFGRLFPAGH